MKSGSQRARPQSSIAAWINHPGECGDKALANVNCAAPRCGQRGYEALANGLTRGERGYEAAWRAGLRGQMATKPWRTLTALLPRCGQRGYEAPTL